MNIEQEEYIINKCKEEAMRTLSFSDMSEDELEIHLEKILEDNIKEVPCTIREKMTIWNKLCESLENRNPLDYFMKEDSVCTIVLNGIGPIYIERDDGSWQQFQHGMDFRQIDDIIQRFLSDMGRSLNEMGVVLDSRLEDGSMVKAILPPIAKDGPFLMIKKLRRMPTTIEELTEKGFIEEETLHRIRKILPENRNILITGEVEYGRMAVLNVLTNMISEHHMIISIEENSVLQYGKNHHWPRLEARNNAQAASASLLNLLKEAVTMGMDYVVLGNMSKIEADVLELLNMGVTGFLSTVRGRNARDVLSKLEFQMMKEAPDIPMSIIQKRIGNVIDVIITVGKDEDGKMKILEIMKLNDE